MFDHVTIRVADREASERFYDTVLAEIGIGKLYSDESGAEWGDFSLAAASADSPVTRRLHVGFLASSGEAVDAFWRAGRAAGYRDDGAPGPRPEYREDYYGGFLLDPDGNSAEAVHHGLNRRGPIDHVWLRVPDLAASRRFYELVAPYTGFELRRELPDRAGFVGEDASFTITTGPPTENAHMAFPARDNSTVDAFYRAAIDAGYRDHGAPGERPVYHEGYYGAYVLDPDGNNIEVVNHNR